MDANYLKYPLRIKNYEELRTPGFPLSMSVMLETLEKIERRSQLDIIRDLVTRVDNITIQGVVQQINTPNADSLSGQIILIGVVVDKLHKIHTELFDREYILAIKAYQERLMISCQGDLIKENNVFILKDINHFTLEQDSN